MACQDRTLRFRCRDAGLALLAVTGFLVATGDNSTITTLTNTGTCLDANFGIGAGPAGNYGDFDATTANTLVRTDTRGRLLYVR